jgi:glycyl-tRNA synthetase
MSNTKLLNLLKRRFFYDQSFAIYGGVTGLYDYGPMGCALKTNMIQYWRRHFILEDSMLEVECSALTPAEVLKASGHVDRFTDWMVKDVKTGECFRADHLIKNAAEGLIKSKKTTEQIKKELEDVLVKLDGFSNNDIHETISKYGFKSPETGNELSEPMAFNLMFPTQIGPTGDVQAYLRPETAQGIFINFKRLLEFNQSKIPFAAAQIGTGFRNEISPRQGLIRVREFTMCEIEHFLDPSDKSHPRFKDYADLELVLYSACDQNDGKEASVWKIGDAVKQKVVDNETLGYYMARTYKYLVAVGVDPNRLRFRQHMSTEMAHYATDCWDAECLTSFGWIECVGNADRACYDLLAHSRTTKESLTFARQLPAPVKVKIAKIVSNKGVLAKDPNYKPIIRGISDALERLSIDEVKEFERKLKNNGKCEVDVYNKDGTTKKIELSSKFISVKEEEDTHHIEEITPGVVEPSFGIGRILYVVLEHSFRERENDEQRNYLALPPLVAPIKCSILPINANKLESYVKTVRDQLSLHDLSYKVDDSSGSIGKRYARTDEIGIPFGVTIDFDTEKDDTVTLRYSPTMQQVRLKIEELGPTVSSMVSKNVKWEEIMDKFPIFQAKQD